MSDEFLLPNDSSRAFANTASGRGFTVYAALWKEARHAVGFKRAADYVIEAYENDESMRQRDELVFPVVYLYRHAIELVLKNLIRLSHVLQNTVDGDSVKDLNSHDLNRLWKRAQSELALNGYEIDSDEMKGVDRILREFHQLDPNGVRLRYDRSTKGDLHALDQLPAYLDLINLYHTMEGLFNFLDCCETDLEVRIEHMVEYELYRSFS